jgi:hypothetical protein
MEAEAKTSEERVQTAQFLRATVYENGSSSNSKVLSVSTTLEEFLDKIRDVFGSPDFSLLYTSRGGQIVDVGVLRYAADT